MVRSAARAHDNDEVPRHAVDGMKTEITVDLGEGTGGACIVTIDVNTLALALRYARRAHKNKGKRVTLANGNIKLTIRPNPYAQPDKPARDNVFDYGHGGVP